MQAVLSGKVNARSQRHALLFRRMLSCAACRYSLIGERQKGHVYYRCHSKSCPKASIREETVAAEVAQFLQTLQYNDQEKAYFRARIMKLRATWTSRREEETRSLHLRLSQIKDRLNRLTDAYLDQALDKAMFDERKKALLLDQKTAEENLANLNRTDQSGPERLEKFLELAGNARLSLQMATPEEKREMVNILTSNRQVDGKKLDLKPSIPFQEIMTRPQNACCAPERDIPRMWDPIIDSLAAMSQRGELPDLSAVPGFNRYHTVGNQNAQAP